MREGNPQYPLPPSPRPLPPPSSSRAKWRIYRKASSEVAVGIAAGGQLDSSTAPTRLCDTAPAPARCQHDPSSPPPWLQQDSSTAPAPDCRDMRRDEIHGVLLKTETAGRFSQLFLLPSPCCLPPSSPFSPSVNYALLPFLVEHIEYSASAILVAVSIFHTRAATRNGTDHIGRKQPRQPAPSTGGPV